MDTEFKESEILKEEQEKVTNKFLSKMKDKEIYRDFRLSQLEENNIKIYVKNASKNFVLFWVKYGNNKIQYQIFSQKTLQRKLWHLFIDGFRKRNNILLKNTISIYLKIYK